MRRSRRIAGLVAHTADEIEFQSRLDGLPVELHDMVKSLVFTSCDIKLETATTLPPCNHSPVHVARGLPLTRIDEAWKPPRWAHVDRASRTAYSKQLFDESSVFVFPSIAIMKKWVESFPAADIKLMAKTHICCAHPKIPVVQAPPGPIGDLLADILSCTLQFIDHLNCRQWFEIVQLAADGSYSSGNLFFVEFESQARHRPKVPR